jgi:hypothetical protein
MSNRTRTSDQAARWHDSHLIGRRPDSLKRSLSQKSTANCEGMSRAAGYLSCTFSGLKRLSVDWAQGESSGDVPCGPRKKPPARIAQRARFRDVQGRWAGLDFQITTLLVIAALGYIFHTLEK